VGFCGTLPERLCTGADGSDSVSPLSRVGHQELPKSSPDSAFFSAFWLVASLKISHENLIE